MNQNEAYTPDSDAEVFYVYVQHEDTSGTIEFSKKGSKWVEFLIDGDLKNIGHKTYQSYLKPMDIMAWLKKDFDSVQFTKPDEAVDSSGKDHTWGFLGTMISNYGLSSKDAQKLYGAMIKQIAKVVNVSDDQIEQFLDSKWGRHLADELSFFGAEEGQDFDQVLKAIQDWAKSPKAKWVAKGIKDQKGELKVENKLVDKVLDRVCEAVGKDIGSIQEIKPGDNVIFKQGTPYAGMMAYVVQIRPATNKLDVKFGKATRMDVDVSDLLLVK